MSFKGFIRLAIICLGIAVCYTIHYNKGLLFYCSVAFFALLLLLDYRPFKNMKLYSAFIICVVLTSLPILNSNFIKVEQVQDYSQTPFYVVVAFLLLMILLQRFFAKKKIRVLQQKVVLFRERKADVERIKNYLEKYNVIGVNGDWGTGKTFVMGYIQNYDLKDKYYYVNIHSLSCNTDDVSNIILNELEAVLFKQGIFSRYAFGIKEIFNAHKYLQVIKSFLHISASTNDMIEGFSKELDESDKPIVIIIEDLDRLIDQQAIRKIFSMAEYFASFSHNVKFMIEYNQNNLYKQFPDMNRSYVEKYVPHVVNLTNLSLYQVIANLFAIHSSEYKNIRLEDFGFLEYKTSVNKLFDGLLEQTQGVRLEIPAWRNAPIRKVENCLKDIDLALDDDKFYRERGALNIVIMHYVLSNFYDKYYRLFNSGNVSVENYFMVAINDREH